MFSGTQYLVVSSMVWQLICITKSQTICCFLMSTDSVLQLRYAEGGLFYPKLKINAKNAAAPY